MVRCKGEGKAFGSKIKLPHQTLWFEECIKAKPKIVVGKLYICPINAHVQNKKLHAFKGQDNVVVQVANGDRVERKKKYLQFVSIFHLLQQSKPMTNFEACKNLFQFLKV